MVHVMSLPGICGNPSPLINTIRDHDSAHNQWPVYRQCYNGNEPHWDNQADVSDEIDADFQENGGFAIKVFDFQASDGLKVLAAAPEGADPAERCGCYALFR